MKLKLLQLNIYRGLFTDRIIDYIKKEQFDVCTLQEVTGGIASKDKKSDTFKLLSNKLELKGILAANFNHKEDTGSYFGNTTFFNPKLNLAKSEVLRFKPFATIEVLEDGDPRWEHQPYSALILEFEYENKIFCVINTHGAWSQKAKDTREKIRQGEMLFEYIKKLDKPFILAGDFNLTRDTKVIQNYESVATNLIRQFNVKSTLNPRLHYAKNLFPSGLAVDHIFISKEFKVLNFQVLENVDLSDHLGISYEVEL